MLKNCNLYVSLLTLIFVTLYSDILDLNFPCSLNIVDQFQSLKMVLLYVQEVVTPFYILSYYIKLSLLLGQIVSQSGKDIGGVNRFSNSSAVSKNHYVYPS